MFTPAFVAQYKLTSANIVGALKAWQQKVGKCSTFRVRGVRSATSIATAFACGRSQWLTVCDVEAASTHRIAWAGGLRMRADYCRFVGPPGGVFLSCALAGDGGFGNLDFNSKPGFDPGYADQPHFMADVNGDGRADYCRFVGPPGAVFLSCALVGDSGFGNLDFNSKPGFDRCYADQAHYNTYVHQAGLDH